MLSNVSNHCYLCIFSILLLYHGSTQVKSGLLDNTYKIFSISKMFWENSELDLIFDISQNDMWEIHSKISIHRFILEVTFLWTQAIMTTSVTFGQKNIYLFQDIAKWHGIFEKYSIQKRIAKNASQIIASYSTLPKWRWHNILGSSQ